MTHDLPIPLIIRLDDRRVAMTISNKVIDLETGETTDCHREGINGRCGLECPVLLAGYCDEEEDMYDGKDKEGDA